MWARDRSGAILKEVVWVGIVVFLGQQILWEGSCDWNQTNHGNLAPQSESLSNTAQLANREKTKEFLATNPFEMGLHTTTGGKAFERLDVTLLTQFAGVIIDHNIMPAIDNLEVLERVRERDAIKAFLFGKDIERALKAVDKGASVLLGDEIKEGGLSPETIREIKKKNNQVLIASEIDVLGKDENSILDKIKEAVDAGVDGVVLKPYSRGDHRIEPDVIQKIKQTHPDLIVVVAGGVFENKVEDVLSLPVSVVAAFGVNKPTLEEFTAQVKSYKEKIDTVLAAKKSGSGARLVIKTSKIIQAL